MKEFSKNVLIYAALAGVVVSVAHVSGCATVTGAVAPEIAKAVTKYCQEPLAERSLIRAQVNGMIAPATIKVTCPGDPAQ